MNKVVLKFWFFTDIWYPLCRRLLRLLRLLILLFWKPQNFYSNKCAVLNSRRHILNGYFIFQNFIDRNQFRFQRIVPFKWKEDNLCFCVLAWVLPLINSPTLCWWAKWAPFHPLAFDLHIYKQTLHIRLSFNAL